jgi:hypothetical protein
MNYLSDVPRDQLNMKYFLTTFYNVPSTILAAISKAGITVNTGWCFRAREDTSVDREQIGGMFATHCRYLDSSGLIMSLHNFTLAMPTPENISQR